MWTLWIYSTPHFSTLLFQDILLRIRYVVFLRPNFYGNSVVEANLIISIHLSFLSHKQKMNITWKISAQIDNKQGKMRSKYILCCIVRKYTMKKLNATLLAMCLALSVADQCIAGTTTLSLSPQAMGYMWSIRMTYTPESAGTIWVGLAPQKALNDTFKILSASCSGSPTTPDMTRAEINRLNGHNGREAGALLVGWLELGDSVVGRPSYIDCNGVLEVQASAVADPDYSLYLYTSGSPSYQGITSNRISISGKNKEWSGPLLSGNRYPIATPPDLNNKGILSIQYADNISLKQPNEHKEVMRMECDMKNCDSVRTISVTPTCHGEACDYLSMQDNNGGKLLWGETNTMPPNAIVSVTSTYLKTGTRAGNLNIEISPK